MDINSKIKKALPYLRCPQSHDELFFNNNGLVSKNNIYKVSHDGIPQFSEKFISEEAKTQAEHYDKISDAYIKNINYPHTQEYLAYLDNILINTATRKKLGIVGEICCGTGEAFNLFKNDIDFGIGIDVSINMLRSANKNHNSENLLFIQGDATNLPLEDSIFDNVFCLGGIHHINDRLALFGEIERVLKPGGRFIWREPVDDFIVWRVIRYIIYKISPYLDDRTEQPLRYNSTKLDLNKIGLEIESWKTYGFFGFCLFMNSDVLIFNRIFKYIPKIRTVVRLFIKLDEFLLNNSLMKNIGLQVIGIAIKPKIK